MKLEEDDDDDDDDNEYGCGDVDEAPEGRNEEKEDDRGDHYLQPQ